jgi:hypothetical protein
MRTSATGETRSVLVEVFLGEIAPEMIAVELYAEAEAEGASPFRAAMEAQPRQPNAAGPRLYVANVPVSRPESSYTPRIILRHPEMRLPLEVPLILWQR